MPIRSSLSTAVAGLAVIVIGLTACDRSPTETANGGGNGASSDAPIDAVPSDARVASSTDGMASATPRRAAPAKTDTAQAPGAGGAAATSALNGVQGAATTSQESIVATKATLSPAGASSGATAPAPK